MVDGLGSFIFPMAQVGLLAFTEQIEPQEYWYWRPVNLRFLLGALALRRPGVNAWVAGAWCAVLTRAKGCIAHYSTTGHQHSASGLCNNSNCVKCTHRSLSLPLLRRKAQVVSEIES